MNKFDKLQIALILQDIESLYTGNISNNITSTAGNLVAGVEKDGLDQQDVIKLMLDQSFDQNPQGVLQKIQNNVALHYEEIEKVFKDKNDKEGLNSLKSIFTNNPDFSTFSNSLSNIVVSKKPGGIIHWNGQKCDTEQCAAFSNSYIRSLGNTTNGNAWNLKDADLIYSGYNTKNRPRKYDQSSVEQYNYEAADTLYRDFKSESLDKDKVYAVNMFYKGSPSLKTAYKDGRDDIAGTHTGYLQFNPSTNRWNVIHNIHGTIHVDDFIGIQGSDGKYGVTAIFEPYNKKDRPILQRIRDFFFAEGGQIGNNETWHSVYVNDNEYKVMLVVSESDKEKGLQDVEELDSNEGMLFDYVDDPQSEISFWMKDTTLALDVVFINDSGIVEDVKHGEPLSEELLTCVPNEGSIIYVLEVLSGSGIKPGDKFSINKNEIEDESTEKSSENNLEILGSNGEVQATLQGGERIFSIKNTKTLVAMAKRAYESKSDSDYKALGRKIFEYMKIQNEREPEYVE